MHERKPQKCFKNSSGSTEIVEEGIVGQVAPSWTEKKKIILE